MGWNWNDLTVATGVPDAINSPIDAYVFAAQSTQHVNYINEPGHVIELWWDNSGWHYNDLTKATNSPPSLSEYVNGYVFSAQGTQHVVYRGADNDIHELWWDSSGWHSNDLTNATGGASGLIAGAGSWGAPYGYAFEAQGTQHVIYRADDGHIIELWWENGSWSRNDLTLAACVTVTVDNTPRGYAFEAQGTQHVNFRGGDGHIYELWWQDGVWNQNDLTVAANAPPALTLAQGADIDGLSGYVFVAQGTQHVLYLGQDYHIHELWWDSDGWHHNDLTNAAGAPSADFWASQPAGYVFESQGTQHVNYQGPDDHHIDELWWDNSGWHYNDLTNAAGAPSSRGESTNPVGYAFEAQGTQHVIYRCDNLDAVELYWTP
jgi:hypothetical protein